MFSNIYLLTYFETDKVIYKELSGSGIIMRLYISTYRGIISGQMGDNLRERVQEYRDVFEDLDNEGSGNGVFESELQPVNSKDEELGPVYVRAESNSIEFGYYGPEGWSSIHGKYEVEVGEENVIFDSMIPYYAHEDQATEYYSGPTYDEIIDSLHGEDIEAFKKVLEEYIESEE